MLANTGKSLNKDATEEEKKFYEEFKHDYKEVQHRNSELFEEFLLPLLKK